MKATLLVLSLVPMLSACAPAVVGAAAGAAAVDYYVDNNNVCNGPNDAGLIDSDCHE